MTISSFCLCSGPSVRENQPFETLCQFQDDAYPVMDTYRSSAKKTLICTSINQRSNIELPTEENNVFILSTKRKSDVNLFKQIY